jgi:hypothetical protein
LHVVTVASRAGLADVEVLAASVRAHHPEATMYAVVVDDDTPVRIPGVEVIDHARLHLPGLDFAEARSALELDELLAIAVPAALVTLLTSSSQTVCHLAPTIDVRARLDMLAGAAERSGLAVALRSSAPLPLDGLRPDDLDVAALEVLRTGVVAASAAGLPALRRWADLAAHVWRRPDAAPLDRLLDHVAATHPHERVPSEHHLDCWNLGARSITCDGDAVLADGNRVVTIDFAGHRADRPDRACADLDGPARRPLADEPVLDELYSDRRARVLAARNATHDPPGLVLAPGVPYDAVMQAAYRRNLAAALAGAAERPPCPVTDPEQFLAWCAGSDMDGPVPLPRYLEQLRLGRPDLLDAFPAVPGRSVPALIEWANVYGHQDAIPARLVPAPPVPAPTPTGLPPGVNLAGFLTAELGVGEVARRLATAMDAASMGPVQRQDP